MRQLKWAWQRLTRGYDDRVMWGFDSYFLQVMPALKKFCQEELKTTATKELNPRRHEVFTETLRLIEEQEKMPYENWYRDDNEVSRLLEYVGRNIGIYWN